MTSMQDTDALSLFDSKAFRAAHPDLATQFISVQPGSRRFLLK